MADIRRHRRAATACSRGGDEDTGSNNDGRVTYNNQQSTKISNGNGDGNKDDDSDNNDDGNEGNGGSA